MKPEETGFAGAWLDQIEAEYAALVEVSPEDAPLWEDMEEQLFGARDALESGDYQAFDQWFRGLLEIHYHDSTFREWFRKRIAVERARRAKADKTQRRRDALTKDRGNTHAPSVRGAMLKIARKRLGPRASDVAVRRAAERLRGLARRAG
jgi:hypothetical protein